MKSIYKALCAMAMLMTLPAAGAVEPRDIVPDSLPANWLYTPDQVAEMPDQDPWWTDFGDALLDSLIVEALSNNYSLDVAQQRMAMAREAVNAARASWYPTLGVTGSWSAARSAGASANAWSVGASMSWEIDLFGRTYATVKGKKALEQASRADYVGTMVSLSAQLATAYINLRMYQTELFVQQEHLVEQQRVLNIVNSRYEATLVSGLDVAQSESVYNTTLAGISPLRQSVDQTMTAIALLVGVIPAEIVPRLMRDAGLPPKAPHPRAYIPAELIRRRPDVVAAERTVAGYAAQLGVAKRDFLPMLTVQGSFGTTARNGSDLFRDRTMTYSVTPTLSWTLFDGFGRRAALQSAREQMQMGIDNYNQTMLTAITEVENAMTAYTNSRTYVRDLQKAVDAAGRTVTLSLEEYTSGLTNYTTVANAQITYLQQATALVEARAQASISVIDLYRSLGGGWSHE